MYPNLTRTNPRVVGQHQGCGGGEVGIESHGAVTSEQAGWAAVIKRETRLVNKTLIRHVRELHIEGIASVVVQPP